MEESRSDQPPLSEFLELCNELMTSIVLKKLSRDVPYQGSDDQDDSFCRVADVQPFPSECG